SGSLAFNHTLQGSLSREAGEDAGNYAITGNLTGPLAGPNYNVTLNNGVFTINPRAITIDISDFDKLYGDADPTFSWAIVDGSLPEGASLEGTLTRAMGEDVGDYAITGELTGDLASPNYTVTLNEGVLTITPRPIIISAEDVAKLYGEADPELLFSQTGNAAPGEIGRAPCRERGSTSTN